MAELGAALEDLAALMARLRSPDGCPWDQRQTQESLRQWLIEESAELLEAMVGPPADHREELGDLLFQIVFQSRLREEAGAFDLRAVIEGITEKMRRRHPHVFPDAEGARVKLQSAEELRALWHQLKGVEKPEREGALSGIPAQLPALLRALRLGQKAARVGFDWPEVAAVWAQLEAERVELAQAAAAEPSPERERAVHHELGDLLFTVVNLARHLDVEPEGALRDANRRFQARFEHMERQASAPLSALSAPALEELWARAKAALAAAESGAPPPAE